MASTVQNKNTATATPANTSALRVGRRRIPRHANVDMPMMDCARLILGSLRRESVLTL
jgi:hypothetical protein